MDWFHEEISSQDPSRQECHQLLSCWIVVAIVHIRYTCTTTNPKLRAITLSLDGSATRAIANSPLTPALKGGLAGSDNFKEWRIRLYVL